MTTCTVEAINAAWTALVFVGGAIACGVIGRIALSAVDDDSNAKMARAWVVALAIIASGLMLNGFHKYGQHALRYSGAGQHGGECAHRGGRVTITYPGDTEPKESKP